MLRNAVRLTVTFIIAICICLHFPIDKYVLAQTQPQVEVEIGPAFDTADKLTVQACVIANFKNRFPWDFLEAPTAPGGEPECPQIEIFQNEYEQCYLLDIYSAIEPAVILGLFFVAIINL